MLQTWVVLLVSFAYLGVLFAIARFGDRRADARRSIITGSVYALSLAVYATSWTFYGSVGRAASSGVGFLPIYLGPTLVAALWWFVLRKIIRISKANRITSIADFISSRYGKSSLLGGLVTVIAVVGIIPYISLQLKAVSNTFGVLQRYPEITLSAVPPEGSFLVDKAFWVAVLLAAFAIAFGTRHLDASERHEGMVAAIAFESVVKLVAFLAIGVFVTFGIYNGFGDLFAAADAAPELAVLGTLEGGGLTYGGFFALTVLSMLAVMFLPRQFQVSVVENVDERHVAKAIWLFPLYMLVINIFVLPITFAGLLRFGDGGDPDMFVLTLAMAEGQQALALFAFIGGLSASTGMVIVETIALSTMVSNDLVVPALLRSRWARFQERADLSGVILAIRRGAIALILLLGYVYFRAAGEAYALVTIGLVSFAAVAQFAPALLGGIYWRRATRRGALAGLTGGFAVWVYTLLLPSFALSGWLPADFLDSGPFGAGILRPLELFGLTGLDSITHGLMWSLLVNVAAFVGVSLWSRQNAAEHAQAALFVDAFHEPREGSHFWRGGVSVDELRVLLRRYLGTERADDELGAYERKRGVSLDASPAAEPELINHAEKLLGGAIGAASARVVLGSVIDEEPLGIEEVMHILDETSQAIAYSRELEQKSAELEAATAELRAANARLTELDRLKDDFISTVTHELRTPLTSIRAFTEILFDNPDLGPDERARFLGIVTKESERLTRLINQVLDLSKLESGQADWRVAEVDVPALVEDALSATRALFTEHGARVERDLEARLPPVRADEDRLMQVLLNLFSNAAKFCDPADGLVAVRVSREDGAVRVDVRDNGPGLRPEDEAQVFEKFRQGGDSETGKPQGTGLGLPISQQIIDHLGGRLWVEGNPGRGARFSFTLPLAVSSPPAEPIVAEHA